MNFNYIKFYIILFILLFFYALSFLLYGMEWRDGDRWIEGDDWFQPSALHSGSESKGETFQSTNQLNYVKNPCFLYV